MQPFAPLFWLKAYTGWLKMLNAFIRNFAFTRSVTRKDFDTDRSE